MNIEFDYTSLMLGLCPIHGLMYFISHFFLLSLQALVVFQVVGITSFISSHNLVGLLT